MLNLVASGVEKRGKLLSISSDEASLGRKLVTV